MKYKILRGRYARPATDADATDRATIVLVPGDYIEMDKERALPDIAAGRLEPPLDQQPAKPRKVTHGRAGSRAAIEDPDVPESAPSSQGTGEAPGGLQIGDSKPSAAVAAAGGKAVVVKTKG